MVADGIQKGMKKKTTTMTRMMISTRMVIIWHLSADREREGEGEGGREREREREGGEGEEREREGGEGER